MIEIFATFIASLCLSSLVGFLVYRSSVRGGRGRKFQVIVGGLVFLVLLLVSFPVLWFTGWRLPSTDMIRFSRVNDISVQFVDPITEVERINFRFRSSVPDYEDFAIGFSLSNTPDTDLRVQLLLPSKDVLSLRTNDKCLANAPTLEGQLTACTSQVMNRSLNVRWLATPHRASVTELVFSANNLKLDQYPIGTVADVFVGEERFCEYRYPDGHLWEPGYDRMGVECVPVRLSQSREFVNIGNSNIGLDVSKGEIRFSVEILTTLGVSRGVYGWLALGGAILSGLLGSGWLWKLLDSRTKALKSNT